MEMTEVPQIDTTNPMKTPDAAAMALTGNLQTDLRNIANEMGVTLDANGNVVEAPAQPAPVTQAQPQQVQSAPAQPQAAEQPRTEVPEKFKNQDGSVNESRLEKSSAALDEAIARYRAKEREFAQLHNSQKANTIPQAQPPQSPQTTMPLSAFEVQIARDLISESQAAGSPMVEGHAVAQARVMARALEAKYAAEMDATAELRRKFEDNERIRELQGLINDDPNLISQEMTETLWAIRQANQYLNKAPEPWKAAYTFYLGSQGRGGQVKTPTPTGLTAKAPPAPVGPVSRVQQTVDLGDKKALEALSLEQLEALTRQQFPGYRGQRK